MPLTFALFEHSSSRLGDPQLHVHAVCPNLTTHTGKDGKIRVTAIDSTEFYHHQMVGGALFRASLAAGMQELGFEIERDGSAFRLKGIDEKLCERFSQRRAEIVEGILKRAGGGTKLSDVDARAGAPGRPRTHRRTRQPGDQTGQGGIHQGRAFPRLAGDRPRGGN